MKLDPKLLAILVCPADDHGTLSVNEANESLECTSCGRSYQVRDGIPVMLLDEAGKA